MREVHQMHYKVARTTQQLCGLLGVDPQEVMHRMNRPADFLENEGRGVTALEYFEGWNAILDTAGRDDAPFVLGQAYARGPLNPAFLAFTCSPTVSIGLDRLALFKPLTGPLHLSMERGTGDTLTLTMTSNVPGLALPPSFSAAELVFFTEAIRTCTGHQAVPLAATLTGDLPARTRIEDFLGCPTTISTTATLTLCAEDADRSLLSSNPEHWAQIEPGFRRQVYLQKEGETATARLQKALSEMLPAGQAQVQDAAVRLRLSVRSLQRHLRDEGTSFQAQLETVRKDLAEQYLSNTDLNVEEISFLLAYRDPNSFYRAFQSWTGQTPGAVRARAS